MTPPIGLFIASESVIDLLLEGAGIALFYIVIAFLLSRYTKEIYARILLAAVLTLVALAYSFLALDHAVLDPVGDAAESYVLLVIELIGVAVFVTMAWVGVRGSRWWLAAGWGLHPVVWDAVLHLVGPGAAPTSITIPCLSMDLLVAGYIALWGHPAFKRALRARAPALRAGAHS